jgi:hypothetical protein
MSLCHMFINCINTGGHKDRPKTYLFVGWFMVFKATFNTMSVISWQSVLLVEGTGVAEENH